MTLSIPLVTLPGTGTGQDTGRLPAPGPRLARFRPAVLALAIPPGHGSQPAPPGRPPDRSGPWLRNAAAGLPGPEPAPSAPEDNLDAVTLTHAQVRTVLTSLDLAAAWKRDRAETCAYCADQSCFACELRFKEARSYDQLAVQLLHDEQAARDARSQPGLTGSSPQPCPGREREAGQ